MGDARQWRVAPVERQRSVALDSLTAHFDRASGQTHLLASPLPEILHALAAGPADAARLTARISADFDTVDSGVDSGDVRSAEAVILARLEELAALGLVSVA